MKYLKIENNRAFFLKKKDDSESWTSIDKIEKENLIDLLNMAIEDDEFEMDEFIDEKLQNKAHNIIYKHISEKLTSIIDDRDKFKEETNSIYKEALDKY